VHPRRRPGPVLQCHRSGEPVGKRSAGWPTGTDGRLSVPA
jgi:hypothetical protein